MVDRQLIAYGLILLMAAAIAGVVWWHVYHSHTRTYVRRKAAERQIELRVAQAAHAKTGTPTSR
ncbi:MAG: hypothetical protein ABIP41_01355 [Croceibacterium sp.]